MTWFIIVRIVFIPSTASRNYELTKIELLSGKAGGEVISTPPTQQFYSFCKITKYRQTAREGGQFLILPSEFSKEVGGLSDLTRGLSF